MQIGHNAFKFTHNGFGSQKATCIYIYSFFEDVRRDAAILALKLFATKKGLLIGTPKYGYVGGQYTVFANLETPQVLPCF